MYEPDPYEQLADLITTNLVEGCDVYSRRATANRNVKRNHGFRTSSNSERLVEHLRGMRSKERQIRQIVLAAVVRAEGRHREVIAAMKEVILDVMGTERPMFVDVALRGLSRGTLRAKAGRVLLAAAKRTRDPYFEYADVTRTVRQVRGMEELLGTVPQSWQLHRYVELLSRGPVAFLKQVILEQIELEEPPELVQVRPGSASPSFDWHLLPFSIETNERASKIPATWMKAARWIVDGIPLKEVARTIFWDELSFGEADVADFDEVYIAAIEVELREILLELKELERERDRNEGMDERDAD